MEETEKKDWLVRNTIDWEGRERDKKDIYEAND